MPRKTSKTKPAESTACCDCRCCDSTCSCRATSALDCCRVEAVVNIDGRGQMVLPKEVREKAGFRHNQKLALVSWMRGDELCCITLQKADDLAELVRRTYGPLLSSAIRGP